METARTKPSLPPNYVTLKQLQELRLREKQQRDEEEERLRGLKEAQEVEKLRGLNEEEEEKRRKDEERLRPPPGVPTPAKPRRWSRSGNGPRPRSANPEARAAKDADWKPIKAATESSNPERDNRVMEVSVNPEARGGGNVGGDLIERGNSRKKTWKDRKKRENRTGLPVKGDYRTVRSEPDRTAETSLQIGNVTEKLVETLRPEPDDGPENNIPIGGDPIERGDSKKKAWKSREKKGKNRTGPEWANRAGLPVKGEYRTARSEPDRTMETSLQIGNVCEKSVETLHPEPDDGPENNIPMGGDPIERGDSKKKAWKSREKKGKNRTGPEWANRAGLRVKGEYGTVRSEPDRTAETSPKIGKVTEKLVETLHPETDEGPGNTIPNRNRARGKRVNRMGRFGEPRASSGGETTGAEMGRWTAGRWDGRFGRGWRSGVGPREGLVWIKKESAS